MLCKPLPTHTTGEFIFNIIGLHMAEQGFTHKQYVDIGTDGAGSMVGKACGFTAHIISIAQMH
jgi:hypothetical protein